MLSYDELIIAKQAAPVELDKIEVDLARLQRHRAAAAIPARQTLREFWEQEPRSST